MATEQETKQKVRINSKLSEQGGFALDEARRLYDARAGQPVPSLYTGISGERQEALDQITALARGGTGQQVAAPAMAEYQKTLSGGYLNENPYLDEIVNRSVAAAGSAPMAGFAGAGRFGSGAMANAMQDTMQSTAANIYGQNYQTERDRMMSMLDRGQQVNNMQYADAERLGGVGAAYEENQMRQSAEEMRQYEAEIEHLKKFLQLMQGNPLMGEKTMSTNTMSLDYGGMATGGLTAAAALMAGGQKGTLGGAGGAAGGAAG